MADQYYSYIRKAEKAAGLLRKQCNITSPPVPVTEIAEQLGLDVIGYDLGEGVSGTLVIKGGKGFIGYNPSHSKKRQRFTIAHELGHFKLHDTTGHDSLFVDQDFLVKYRSNNTYTHKELIQEQQANAFAAELLMPEEFLMEEISKLPALSEGELIEYLARIFDVSIPAMTYRLNNLNLNFFL